MNRPLTYYPQVKLFDVVLARILVEIATGFLALLFVSSILIVLRSDPIPAQPFTAMCGYIAVIILDVGVGIINVAIIGFFPSWLIGYALFSIILYVSSGVIFLPRYMPDKIYYWMKFNPALQLAEWVRSSYHPYDGIQVDNLYVVMFGLTSAAIGLFIVKQVVSKLNA